MATLKIKLRLKVEKGVHYQVQLISVTKRRVVYHLAPNYKEMAGVVCCLD